MKRYLSLLCCLIYLSGFTQKAPSFTSTLSRLSTQPDATWISLMGKLPVIHEDSVLFLYRGPGTTVQWMGDFNGWGYDKKFNSFGKQIAQTDIWYFKTSFPKDTRLDYKILIDDNKWILDPENPHQQWSGVGGGSPNSELRMPLWKEDPWLQENNDIPHGTVKTDILLSSKKLGYQINYSVYLPKTEPSKAKHPVIYVTDGYEYLHPKMGNMTTILDNLIAAGKIQPVIAVFIDHREPVDRTHNKRMEELAMNAKYLSFFVDELIPIIESTYPAEKGTSARAILGTSMGGLNAAYFLFTRPDIFSMAGIQSPAFYTRPQIYSLCNNASSTKIKLSMTSGLINDTSEGSQKMKSILETNACEYHYREVNDGHSWGNWRNLIDDILIDLLGQP